jgi:ABC-type multidrug transport system fused ATPase/permease subunit
MEPVSGAAVVLANFSLALVSLRRIEGALDAPETTKFDHGRQPSSPNRFGFHRVHATWSLDKDSFALQNLNLSLTPGLHVVAGRIADGKSSILLALLHEMLVRQGVVFAPAVATVRFDRASKRTAFCAQSPFLLSGTIRDNILWGSPYNETR